MLVDITLEKCETCGGSGGGVDDSGPGWAIGEYTCSTCHGSGRVYPAELVERIAEALLDHAIARGYMLPQFRSVQRHNELARAVAILEAL